MIAVILRIFKQMINDKRSLALILLAPVVIMTFMYFIFGESSYTPKIAIIGMPAIIENAIKDQNLEIIDAIDDVDTMLNDRTVDGVIYYENGKVNLKMYELDSIKLSKITKEITSALKQLNPSLAGFNVIFLYGDSTATTFDSLGYVLLGVFSFFFVFLIAGVSFIRERTLGTMERFMLSPITRTQAVAGFLLGFGFFAVLQSIIIVVFVKYVLGLVVVGSLFSVIILMVLLSFVAVALGALVSTFANNEFQVIQFIPLIIVPQIFLSGVFPIDVIPLGLGYLAYATPVYYACRGLNDVMVKGFGIVEILPECMMLLLFMAILFVANILLLRKYRTI